MKKSKKIALILASIVGFILVLYFALLTINYCFSLALRNYIKSFDKVEYENQLVPSKDEDGYYTFTTNNDFRIMNLTDIHLGGGLWSYRKDKKTIYEVMTMVQIEKPDLVILDGDNTFAVPGPLFNGGGTLNNKMVAKDVICMFEQLGVYFTTVFGNHDTEAFDYTSRENLGKLYSKDKYKYCIFDSNFSGYGVSNQVILIKNTDNKIRKVLLMIDSNDYIDNSLNATINWLYDTIHDEQVLWAKDVIDTLSRKEGLADGLYLKSLAFFHIPISEFEVAYRDLESNNFENTSDTMYISGVYDELVDEDMGGRIWYGGCSNKDINIKDHDILFEELGPDGINTLDAIFVGHDHVNNALVKYRGVYLSYGYSIDNLAYDDIASYGLQRGATVITIKEDNTFTIDHNNAYTHYGIETDMFRDINLSEQLYKDYLPNN